MFSIGIGAASNSDLCDAKINDVIEIIKILKKA